MEKYSKCDWDAPNEKPRPPLPEKYGTDVAKKMEHLINCAKRSLRPSASQNQMFRVSVRPSVRSFSVRSVFVRKIITFCRWHMRGGHTSEDSGVLKTRFFRN